EPEEQGVAVVGVTHERRERRNACRAGGTPAALSRDQLEASLAPAPDDDRLQDPLEADRRCEPGGRLRLEPPSRLARVRMDGLDGEMEQLRLTSLSEEHLETAAETAAFPSDARQAPSPPSSRPASRRSAGRRRSQGARGSAPRRGGPSVGRSR